MDGNLTTVTETDWDHVTALVNLYGIAGEVSGLAWAIEHGGELEADHLNDVAERMEAELVVLMDSLALGADDGD